MQVCRVLAAVNSRNPLNVVAKTSASRRGSSGGSSSANVANKLAAANAAAGANSAASASAAAAAASPAAGATSNGSSAAVGTPASHTKEPLAARDPLKDPLKAFHSLFGLSPAEARDVYNRGEAEGGEGAGEGALKKELARRKGAYIRVVLTVAPCLGMTHANPGMQREVSRGLYRDF